jgi:MFS family permease
VSLFALVPGTEIGWPALVVGILGVASVVASVVASLLSVLRVRRTQPDAPRNALFLIGLSVMFALQIVFGALAIEHPDDAGHVDAIAVLVIACFLIGIARSWELIRGPRIGLRHELQAIVRDP